MSGVDWQGRDGTPGFVISTATRHLTTLAFRPLAAPPGKRLEERPYDGQLLFKTGRQLAIGALRTLYDARAPTDDDPPAGNARWNSTGAASR